MTKKTLLMFAICSLLTSVVYAAESKLDDFDQWSEEFSSSLKTSAETPVKSEASPSVAPRKKPAATAPKLPDLPADGSELVDLSSGDGRNDIERLERRMASLERSVRMLDDRVRNLDRTVDDIRRRV